MTTDIALVPQPCRVTSRPGHHVLPPAGLNSAHTTIDASRHGQFGDEGYELTVTSDSIQLLAATERGVFYGRQTLSQLESSPGVLPCVHIEDRPRFRWRGMHLDVCRHFFPVPDIKRYIDLLAFHKLNIFHWHLTEDQGWRIAINRYPRLTEIGACRRETPIPSDPAHGDGKPYGGFYTQQEIREVVAYASERHITVVPEIEIPGHALAALAAYPELSCTGGPFAVRTQWGIEPDVFCAGNDKVFEFLENVLGEVLDLFPGEFIHIGGDECPKDRWKCCPRCQARMKAEGLKDEHELQSYFIRRIESFLNARGRRLIGWDEILEGGLAPNAAVMSWRGAKGGLAAARAGHDAVMTPNSDCYFNYCQSQDPTHEPPGFTQWLPLEKVYRFEPVPVDLPVEKHHHIIGAQGCLWTEYVPTWPLAEYMVFPRLCALAEVVWSLVDRRDFADFESRLRPHLKRLDRLGVNYRKLS